MAKPEKINDGITSVVETVTEESTEPMVRVFIPLAEDSETELKVDQTETVTINGKNYRIKRGEYVDVKASVFIQLKQRYPNL